MKRLGPTLVIVLALGACLGSRAVAGTLDGSSEERPAPPIGRDEATDAAFAPPGNLPRAREEDFTPAVAALYLRPGGRPSSRPSTSSESVTLPSDETEEAHAATLRHTPDGGFSVMLDEFAMAWITGAGPMPSGLPDEDGVRQHRSVVDPVGAGGLIHHTGLAEIGLSALAFSEIFEGQPPLLAAEPGILSDTPRLSLIFGLAFAGIALAGILARRRWRPGPGRWVRRQRHVSTSRRRRRRHTPAP